MRRRRAGATTAASRLSYITDGRALRLFVWKLHNAVSASIERSEAWYKPSDSMNTSRYWPNMQATLRRAEAALPAREAVESLDAYLEKWPTHMNAILMRAHAAQQARDAGAALHWFGKAIDLEPQNARLLAMAAAVRLAIGEHEEGAALLERALAPAHDSHDAEDEAGRKKLAQVLTQVYMKYGRGPDDFETIPY